MNAVIRCLGFAWLLSAMACQTPGPALQVVDAVDLKRYAGEWYEIASYPQRFQRGCVATRASYTLLDAERVRVVNECREESLDGELRSIEGVAWLSDPGESSAKLRVQFFWPFSGAYWIIALDPDYRFAVVGHPSREYLWILSRTPTIDATTYDALVAGIEAQGYDASRLQRTLQVAP